MTAWFIANLGTMIISLILIAVVVLIIRTMIRDKKRGISSCGGNCAHCKACSSCRGRS
ncbi:MAG: FeoB-associated Cys-rich membrane protein [Lachnospiraceae bacterium]|nr:FeoB-associated Cys-rich membrane protein [Lachnospiraceae bacterium]